MVTSQRRGEAHKHLDNSLFPRFSLSYRIHGTMEKKIMAIPSRFEFRKEGDEKERTKMKNTNHDSVLLAASNHSWRDIQWKGMKFYMKVSQGMFFVIGRIICKNFLFLYWLIYRRSEMSNEILNIHRGNNTALSVLRSCKKSRGTEN